MGNSVQLLGISNAIVDVLAHVDEAVFAKLGVPRGSMTLVDEARAAEIYELMGPATEMSGGSVANTVANFAELGGRAAYIGRVSNDQLGEIFVHDMRTIGVDVRLEPAPTESPTARSHIIITPDGQRTMQTYLGACTELGVADITEDTIGEPEILLLEGYVWDLPEGPALLGKAIDIAGALGAQIALSLSDSFCVDRHRDEYLDAIRNDIDIVFADDDEVMALYGIDEFDALAAKLAELGKLFVTTRSEKGSVIVHGDVRVDQNALSIDKVVDTTGAGDAYAAGFLLGLTSGKPLQACAQLGTYCATNIIQQVGARIDKETLELPGT